MKTPDIPTLLAVFHDGRGEVVVQQVFWCDHCQSLHTHGFPTGHRNAHCHNPDSPYIETGYYIYPNGTLPGVDWPAEKIRTFIKMAQAA